MDCEYTESAQTGASTWNRACPRGMRSPSPSACSAPRPALYLPDIDPHAPCDIRGGERGGEQADCDRGGSLPEELDRYAYRREGDECRRDGCCHDSPCPVSHIHRHLPRLVHSYTRGAYIADICECLSIDIPQSRLDSTERPKSPYPPCRVSGESGEKERYRNAARNDCRRHDGIPCRHPRTPYLPHISMELESVPTAFAPFPWIARYAANSVYIIWYDFGMEKF